MLKALLVLKVGTYISFSEHSTHTRIFEALGGSTYSRLPLEPLLWGSKNTSHKTKADVCCQNNTHKLS